MYYDLYLTINIVCTIILINIHKNWCGTSDVESQAPKKSSYYRAEVFLENGGQMYDIMGYTQEQVIADIITQYENHLYYLHVSDADKTLV